MKKFLCPFLAILLLCGCDYPNQSIEKPISFYYISQNTEYQPGQSLIREQIVEGADMGNTLDAILTAYLIGPDPDTQLQSPFPTGTALISVNRSGEILYVKLSGRFAQLSGIQLSVACACITKTCISLCDAKYVRIQAVGGTLDGAEYIQMDAQSVLLADNDIPESE